MKSNKPIKKEYEVLGKRMYIFPEEYGNDVDPVTRKKCMVVSINDQNTYVPVVEQSDSITESLNRQSGSDSLDSIETDLNATDLDNLDQGAAAIQADLNGNPQ